MYVFENSGDNWEKQQKIEVTSSDNDEFFGTSADLSGDAITLITGADQKNTNGEDAGAAYIFSSNSVPTADAGDDKTVSEEDNVELDATESNDPDGDSLSYSWTQTAGPGVTLTDGDTATPTFTAPAVDSATELVFELTVDDGSVTDTDTTTVTVQPVEDEGPPPIVGENPPTDPDDDGLYEDVDGDGDLSIVDVQIYFQEICQQRDSEYVQNNLQYFDFNGDGSISVADVQLLFEEFQQE